MAKKKRSEYTKQRERIKKVYKRIDEKGYKPIETFSRGNRPRSIRKNAVKNENKRY